MTNQPEKPHFDGIYALARQNKENSEDMKELYKAAKEAGVDVKLLRRTVKLALEDEDKRDERRELESQAEVLLRRLGPYAETDLGAAAMERARG